MSAEGVRPPPTAVEAQSGGHGGEQPDAFYDTWYNGRIDPVVVPTVDDFVYGHMLRALEPNLRTGCRMLDYGCGDGVVGLFAATKGCLVTGVDFAPAAVARAQATANSNRLSATFVQGDFRNSTVREQFDIVVAAEVIEHVEDDVALMLWLSDRLGPGGLCILSTPLSSDPMHRLRKWRHGRDWADDNDGHVRRYTPESVVALIETAGLQRKQVFTTQGVVRSAFYKYRWPHRLWRLCRRLPVVMKVLDKLDILSARITAPAQVVVIAAKP